MERPPSQSLRDKIFQSALDDFESLDTLKKDVASWAKEEGETCSDDEFMVAFCSLVKEGKLNSYLYDPDRQQFDPVGPSADMSEGLALDRWYKASRREG